MKTAKSCSECAVSTRGECFPSAPGKRIWACVVLFSGVFAAPCLAQEWYGAISAGGVVEQQVVRSFAGSPVVKSDFDRGVAVSGAVGMREGRLRFEGELMWSGANVQKIKNLSTITGGHGSVSSTSLMANLYLDFPGLTSSITPYVGGGVGYSRVRFAHVGVKNARFTNDSDGVFSFQAKAGIAYHFNERTDLTLQYRLFGTQTPEMRTAGGVDFESDGLLNHHAEVGVLYRF